MRERPILFGASMVRAILAGTKTQTRRIIKPQPVAGTSFIHFNTAEQAFVPWKEEVVGGMGWSRTGQPIPCPYGAPGDRLWVREKFGLEMRYHPMRPPEEKRITVEYAATPYGQKCSGPTIVEPPGINWDCKSFRAHQGGVGLQTMYLPSIHMPRWACRLILEVVSVRVERLQEISEDDAMAEGVSAVPFYPSDDWPRCEGYMVGADDEKSILHPTARDAYRDLWDKINGKRASWESNPWVWVIEFRRVDDSNKKSRVGSGDGDRSARNVPGVL